MYLFNGIRNFTNILNVGFKNTCVDKILKLN